MPTIEMTENEAKVFLVMLEQAADEFSSHGCNDFNVASHLKITNPEAEEVAKDLRVAMVRDKILDDEAVHDRGVYLYDWMILSWLKVKIRNATTGA